jgi:hypothetical protein
MLSCIEFQELWARLLGDSISEKLTHSLLYYLLPDYAHITLLSPQDLACQLYETCAAEYGLCPHSITVPSRPSIRDRQECRHIASFKTGDPVGIEITAVASGTYICDADALRKDAAVQKDHADRFPEAQLILAGLLPRLQDIEVPEPVPVLLPEAVRYITADFIAILTDGGTDRADTVLRTGSIYLRHPFKGTA